jgi:hypothetical protein
MRPTHQPHKEIPTGWLNFAQQLAGALQDRAAEERLVRPAPRPRLPTLPGDLHHLAAPH